MSNEWYTPAKYIEAARSVMGSIDLDPASCKEANETVKATRYYHAYENGLALPWWDNVWCNPPYGRIPGQPNSSLQSLFIQKLLSEYHQGHIFQAILLCTADPDEKWFQPLWDFPICFTDHKVWFHRPGLKKEKHIMGTCFVYLGQYKQRFSDVFSEFGPVVERVSSPLPLLHPA